MNPATDVVEANPFLPDDLPARATALEDEVKRAEELAEGIVVDSPESAEKARDALQAIKRQSDAIEAERKSLTKPRKDAAEEIKRVYDGLRKPFDTVGDVIKGTLSAYLKKVEEEARERQRLIDEERERVEREAREKREAAEQAEREAAELATEAEASEDDQAVAAELAAEAQREAERAAVTETAIQSLPADKPVEAPALAGFSQPKRLTAEVVDFALVPDHLPDGTPLKVVDMVALRKWALAQPKESLPELPGCEFERKATGTRVGS